MKQHRCAVPQGVVIRALKHADVPAALRIADDQLGQGYLSPGNFIDQDDRFLQDAPTRRKLLLVAVDEAESTMQPKQGERVLGFLIAYIQNPMSAGAMLRVTLPDYIRRQSRIGSLKTVAVSREMQGKGVGSALVHEALDRLVEDDVHSVYSLAWRSPRQDRANLLPVLVKHEFSKFAEIPEYWNKDSLEQNYMCPSCGNPPCHCIALGYGRRL